MDRRQSLVENLRQFTPFDATEATHRERMLALAAMPGDVLARDHFQPGHFTASAFILSPDGGSLLLIHHSKLNRWLQPGGHVEPTDVSIHAAAMREVVEEVGITSLKSEITGIFDVDIHPIPARKAEPLHEHFDVRFLFKAIDRTAAAGSDAAAFRWVPIDQVTVELTDESVMRAMGKVRRRG